MGSLLPLDEIVRRIYLIRGRRVMLDSQLASLYGVATYNLNKSVRRNRRRFPGDFMFRLTREEYASLRFQTGILKRGKHSKYLPCVFTEHGVAMLSSVLRSNRAIDANIAILRAFFRLRDMVAAHKELARRLAELEGRVGGHDAQIRSLFDAFRASLVPPDKPARRIGFVP